MAEWAFQAYDTVTGAATAILQVESWTHEAWLNHETDRFTCRLAPPETPTLARHALNSTIETRCVILPVRDGKLLDGFSGWVPPGGRRRSAAGLELAGGCLLNVFDYRHLGATTTFVAVDQHTIAVTLVENSQAPAPVEMPTGPPVTFAIGPGIDTSEVELSGVLRDQTWNQWESKAVGEALRQKRALINGYDYAIHTELDVGAEGLQVPVRRLRCWYPRRGTPWIAGQSPVFTVGGNAHLVPDVNGNENFGNMIHALGDEVDETTRERLIRFRSAVAYQTYVNGYPLIGRVLDLPDVNQTGTLDDHADGYLHRNRNSTDDEIVLDVDPDQYDGSLGDEAMVVIPAGIDPWWPDGYAEQRRVVAHLWSYDSTGERLRVVTSPPWEAAT